MTAPDSIDSAMVYDHEGNFKQIDVDPLRSVLYKLRPRRENETPKDRVKAVDEAAAQIKQLLLEVKLEALPPIKRKRP